MTSERLLSCRRMPTKKHESYSHVFTTRWASNNIIHRESVIVTGRESERFLKDLLIADDKSNDTRNMYLWITTRMLLLIIFSSRERNDFAGEALFPSMSEPFHINCWCKCWFNYESYVYFITSCYAIWLQLMLREMKDRMAANWGA